MKTLRQIFKDLLKINNPKKNEYESATELEKEEREETNNSNQQEKEKSYETEIDEDFRHSELDNSDVREDTGTDKVETSDESGTGESESDDRGRLKGEETIARLYTESEMLAEKSKAYELGLRDGRNSQIEELYFPKGDDGLPRFNGAVTSEKSSGSIFSMAREA